MTIRVAFGGTPPFAATILAGLLAAPDFEVAGVFTQPPKPRGRGLPVEPSSVEQVARNAGIPVEAPARWSDETTEALRSFETDIFVTAAYGVILPERAFSATRLGAVNVHTSFLPRWRGAAPVQRAIEAGDRETGVSIFVIEKDVDSGPVLARERVPIDGADTAETLLDKLAVVSARVLPDALRRFHAGDLRPEPQAGEAIYARKLQKEEGRLSWMLQAEEIARKCRAFAPWPGVAIGDLKLIEARVEAGATAGEPGAVVSVDPLRVSTAAGVLRLDRVQRAGGRAMTGADYARGRRLKEGDRL